MRRYKFGDGLSLTTFDHTITDVWTQSNGLGISMPRTNRKWTWEESNAVVASITVQVENTGTTEGDEVVLLFVQAPPLAVAAGAPQQQLAAFRRVTVAGGATATVTLDVTARHFRVPTHATAAATAAPWHFRVGTGPHAPSESVAVAFPQ